MPGEVWADWLEESGERTAELRAWLAYGMPSGFGLRASAIDQKAGFGNGETGNNGDGYGRSGAGGGWYIHGDGFSEGWGHGYGYEDR